jgi:hypothetical protein
MLTYRNLQAFFILLATTLFSALLYANEDTARITINLKAIWQLDQKLYAFLPKQFNHNHRVPGLIHPETPNKEGCPANTENKTSEYSYFEVKL